MAATPSSSARRRSTGWVRSGSYILVIASLMAVAASEMFGWRLVLMVALAAGGMTAALVRRNHPYALVAVAWATTVLATQVLLIPALFNLGLRSRGWRGLITIALTFALLAGVAARGERIVSIEGVDLETLASFVAWLLNSLVVVLVPYLTGFAVAARRDLIESYRLRAEHAEAERSARAAEAVLRERARIASDAHDVLGHKLSLLTMQAGGLELNADAGTEVVKEQAHLLRRSARDALDDLRLIIGSVEGSGAPATDAPTRSLVPQGLLGIRALIAESRSSGAIVELVSSGLTDPDEVPDQTSRAAYRIVQECLTNAHRHAPDSPVTISLAGVPGESLGIEVRNVVACPSGHPDSFCQGRRGLLGLKERARHVGGRLTATEADSVFIVRAELPWPERGSNPSEAKQ